MWRNEAKIVGAALLVGMFPSSAIAQAGPGQEAAPSSSDEDAPTPDVTVTGVRQPYRGDFALAEVPQSIAEISAERLQENNVLRIQDALDLNASVSRQNSFGGLFDAFAVRGFAGDDNLPTGYLVNGFNGGRGFGGTRDVAGIERIEVLKGPAAAVLGRGEPGGTVNLVTKQAAVGRTFGSVALQYGDFDRVRAEADANLTLTGGLAVRLIGYAEEADSFRDTVQQQRYGILPSIGFALGARTRLTYDLELTRTEVPFDRGIVVLNDDFRTVPRSRFFGEPGDGDIVAKATGHQLRLQHQFSDDWSLLAGASLRETSLAGFSTEAELVRSRQAVFRDGRSLSRQRRFRRYDSEQMVARAELSGEFFTGGLRHRVLFGADHERFDNEQDFRRFRPPVVTATTTVRAGNVIDLFEPVYGRFPLPAVAPLTDRLDRQRATGLFVQDQVSLTDRLQVRVGGRFDSFTLRSDNRLTGVRNERERSRFSPQAGVVYRVTDPVSLYAAYGEGFRANVGANIAGVVFEPETTKSIETGVKLVLFGGRLTGTAAVFQLEKSNVLAADAANPGFSVAIGRARSRGLELDVTGRLPGGFDLLFSYAYIDAEARSRTLDPNFSFQINPGDRLVNIPDHNVNVQLSRDFMIGGRQAKLGGGVQHVGERSGETGSAFTLPSHTLVRAFGEVELVDGVQLFAAVNNLFDERWYANSFSPLWVQPGQPRTAAIGLRGSF